MAKIHYLDDDKKYPKSLKRGGTFVVVFLVLAFLMGIVGGVGSIMLLSNNSSLQKALGIKSGSLNLTTTKSEKLKLEESSAIIDSVKKVTPAVVSITTSANVQDFFGNVTQQEGGGTGFIITNDGLILTNKHVASAGDSLTVLTADGKTYPAKVAALDPTDDLAILKIEATGLPVVDLGDSNDLQIGQWVIAVGNALGEFQNTVTVGVVSARERQITASGGIGSTSEELNGLIQTDAAINAGNSGGTLVNLAGQVVGVNTAVAGNAQNIGFAIPINRAKAAIESYKKTGKIVKPQLGVRYQMIDKNIAKTYNLKVNNGAWVVAGRGQEAIIAGSPADKAGLKLNDIIIELNGEAVDLQHTLAARISQYQPGDQIEIKYNRDGKEYTTKATLTSTS